MGKPYNYKEIEQKYQKKWEKEQIYAYSSNSEKENFIIDTPPPTVSGSLHIGHIFSYTQTDILARFHRMMGKNVFYPMGWDDNGLPTEKRIQNLYAVKCDPKLSYNPNFKAQKTGKKNPVYQAISRKNFLEICHSQTIEDEAKYKQLWNRIALSVDWNQTYRTIEPYSQFLAQLSFLDLYKKNLLENRFSPVLWDTQFQTAVAQADLEDREQKGFYYDIAFQTKEGEPFTISTTRPELLPACVAISAHPEDQRYQKLFGKTAISPLFQSPLPILPSPHADPKKGTGILMICTFGDMEDVAFCKKHKLPLLQIIDDEGFFMDISYDQKPFQSLDPQSADSIYKHLKGLRVKQARKKIVEILTEKQQLKSPAKECLQYVKFYEKGDFPLEILPKRQWYIKILDHKEELLRQGRKIQWHPPSMKKRYEQWVEGLNQDWCISRQRQYGVPFPVWYKLDNQGRPDYEQAIMPEIKDFLGETTLPLDPLKLSNPTPLENLIPSIGKNIPIDPLRQTPKGGTADQRDKPGGWTADPDVMDTWATSSLSPYINSSWLLNLEKHKKLCPADLRPQAHEIIRTWAFYTIAKSYFHEQTIPWKNIAISGWVVTKTKKKMSKSKGNALEPENLIDTFSADAVRYWAGKARLGQDTLYDENILKIGKKLTGKIFNAFRFVQIQLEGLPFTHFTNKLQEVTVPIDRAWIKKLLHTKCQTIKQFQDYNYSLALDLTEKNFWAFCDNYLEFIKARVYQLKDSPEGHSGKIALDYSFYIFLKLFAPYLPYVTEEAWSKRYHQESSSLHSSLWLKENLIQEHIDILTPQRDKKEEDESLLETAFSLLEQVRKAKSELNKSLASPLQRLDIKANKKHLQDIKLCKGDLARASHVQPTSLFVEEQAELLKPEAKITL